MRLQAFFFGHVQGVGFRYTVQSVAGGFAVTGWVRNRSDGSVEVVAEGSTEELKAFVAEIERSMSGYIDSKKVMIDDTATGEFDDFSIRGTH